MMQEQALQNQIYQRALALLSRREHSVQELHTKLGNKFPQCDRHIQQACASLEAQGYLSDARFAEVYARSRLNRGFGRMRIERELKQKGIPAETARTAFDEAARSFSGAGSGWQEVSVEAAVEVPAGDQLQHLPAFLAWRKKFSSLPQEPKEKARQYRFLLYRGFSQGEVNQLLTLLKQVEEELSL